MAVPLHISLKLQSLPVLIRKCVRPIPISAIERCYSSGEFNQPLSGNDLPRPAGIASFMRLPVQNDSKGLDACFVGVPLDTGTSNRAGTRFGPRQIRSESVMLRPHNMSTGASPFSSLQTADVGDVRINMYNLPEACRQIKEQFSEVLSTGCTPLTMGGDHTITYPILQAVKEKYGSVGLIHVDAHTDTNDTMFGEKVAHGTPFRRAVEEDLIDSSRVIQIGLRGTGYTADDYNWCRRQFWRFVTGDECWGRDLAPLMEEVRAHMGQGPVYLSFDIDALDPAYAPGTGTPEIAGLTPAQGLQIIRGCRGLNLVGADLVEVSPPYDTSGNTAIVAANLLFEMLCVLPGVEYQ